MLFKNKVVEVDIRTNEPKVPVKKHDPDVKFKLSVGVDGRTTIALLVDDRIYFSLDASETGLMELKTQVDTSLAMVQLTKKETING